MQGFGELLRVSVRCRTEEPIAYTVVLHSLESHGKLREASIMLVIFQAHVGCIIPTSIHLVQGPRSVGNPLPYSITLKTHLGFSVEDHPWQSANLELQTCLNPNPEPPDANPKSQTKNLKVKTLDPKPCTPNPAAQTLADSDSGFHPPSAKIKGNYPWTVYIRYISLYTRTTDIDAKP